MSNEYDVEFDKFIRELKKIYPDLSHTDKQVLTLNKEQENFANEIKNYLFVIALKKIFKDDIIVNELVMDSISKKSLHKFPSFKDEYDNKKLYITLKIIINKSYLIVGIDVVKKDLLKNEETSYSIAMPCYDFNKLIIRLFAIREEFRNNSFLSNYLLSISMYEKNYTEITRDYFEYNKSIYEHNIRILSKVENKMSNDISLLLSLCSELCIDYNLLIKLNYPMMIKSRQEYYENLFHILNLKNIDQEDIIKIYALFSNYVTIKDKYVL